MSKLKNWTCLLLPRNIGARAQGKNPKGFRLHHLCGGDGLFFILKQFKKKLKKYFTFKKAAF